MKIKKSDWFNIATVLIASISIAISIRSCNISNKSLELTVKDYNDKFKTVLVGTYITDKNVIEIQASNKNIILQRATAYYPKSISDSEWEIKSPDYYLYMTVPIFNIQEFIKKKIPIKSNYFQILDNARIPVIIESYYTFNGDNFYELSLYFLEYLATINDDSYSLPDIKINGLIFGERLNINTDKKDLLSKIWNEIDSEDIKK